MSKWNALGRSLLIGASATIITALNLGSAFGANYDISDQPLFLRDQPPPLNMLVMSRDHRMYYEAYNDASDIDGDGVIDSKYITRSDFKYFGYFNSDRCYTYANGMFSPSGKTGAEKACAGGAGGQWSGDWLNYITTSRMDALRKVLYGGLRSTDTAAQTVLQRAFIPQDAHSWGKSYTSVAVDGYDITKYAAVNMPTSGRHLFANTTPSASGLQSGNPNPAINGIGLPLLRVLTNRNNFIWDWLSAERLVADTNIHSGASQGGVTPTDYVVRVEVCTPATKDDEGCKIYPNGNAKPTGLLQDYGESDRQLFGLLTGSYGAPHEGGVLRKAVGSLKDEITTADGTFKQTSPPGIINTIDRLRITGFNTDAYSCGWITDSSDATGKCSMWGNPTAEMMYETMRYFAGKSDPTAAFHDANSGNGEESSISITMANWTSATDPYKQYPYCSKPYETVISDINPSYDSDKIPGSTFGGAADDIKGGVKASELGDKIWAQEVKVDPNLKATTKFFIGESKSESVDGSNRAPTPKTVDSFGNIRGLSPEGPTKEGSYMSGSVAYFGRITDLNDAKGEQKVRTFAVALASPLPRIEIPVGDGKVTLVPFAKSVGGSGINPDSAYYQPTNQIVDFYVDHLTPTEGVFRVNFEDVEQGADHDMDAIAIYSYQVINGEVFIKVQSEYAAGGIIQHMGYVISGTTQDGTYLEVRDVDTAAGSDPDYFLDTPPGQYRPGAVWNDKKELPLNPPARKFTPGSTAAAGFLKDPLYYAAKWGGFKETKDVGNGNNIPDQDEEWSSRSPGKVPDNYFLVTSAIHLREQLSQAFDDIDQDAGSASSAAVSSGSISDDTRVYQAEFLAQDWAGHLRAYPISDGDTDNDGNKNEPSDDVPEGMITTTGSWDAADVLAKMDLSKRRVVTPSSVLAGSFTGTYTTGLPFAWDSLTTPMQQELRGPTEADDINAKLRLNYLRGDKSQELPKPGIFRKRSSLLGDIVNSGPAFVGAPRARYPDSLEAQPYSAFRADNSKRQSMVYVGANDGMLHAFDAKTGEEVFAYIPRSVFANLPDLTSPAYTHKFYVDGTPSIGDAFIGGSWHTVLAAGLNKGGQGVFALDITNPGGIATEADAAKTLLWEFTDAQDADLGYTYARPTIARLKDGKWYAIFGNGYNNTDTRGGKDTHVSTTGEAVLYFVDVATGNLTYRIGTGAGISTADLPTSSFPNGLSTPAVADLNGDSVADYAFAGDLYGNLWKFDLTGSAPVLGNGGKPLFKAKNDAGRSQPITVKPSVDIGPKGLGMIVLFGTGKFIEPSDRNVTQSASSVQSFYGIYDANGTAGTTLDRSTLVKQEITGQTTITIDSVAAAARATTNNAVPAGRNGWYMDLVLASATPTYEGERVVTDPVLRNGRVLFTTLIPDEDPCAYGGRSWLMEMNEMTGARLDYSPFDFNNDRSFNTTDYITVTVGTTTSTIPASGFSRDAIMSRPAVIAGQYGDYAIMTDTSGGGLGVKPKGNPDDIPDQKPTRLNPGPGAIGRQSWRQLR